MKKGTKVKTWISQKVGTVVKYNSNTNEVTVKYKGIKGYDVLPASMCSKIY